MYGLLRKALGEKLKKATEKDPGLAAVVPGHAAVIPATVDTDGAIGIPRDTIEYHRRMGHIKLQKVHAFLCHGYSKYMCLVWIVVSAPLMVLHYSLFRHGTFWNQRDHDDDVSIFDFVGSIAKNRVAVCLQDQIAREREFELGITSLDGPVPVIQGLSKISRWVSKHSLRPAGAALRDRRQVLPAPDS